MKYNDLDITDDIDSNNLDAAIDNLIKVRDRLKEEGVDTSTTRISVEIFTYPYDGGDAPRVFMNYKF